MEWLAKFIKTKTLLIVTDSNVVFMGVVRIDNKLQKEIKLWIKKGGNVYQYPTVTSFINSAIYEKIQKENGKQGVNNGDK